MMMIRLKAVDTQLSIANYPVEIPFSELEDSYKSEVDYLSVKAWGGEGGIGLFSHPPFVQYKGGQMQPVSISTKLMAGMDDVKTIPDMSGKTSEASAALVELVERVYSMALPQKQNTVGVLRWPPYCALSVYSEEAQGRMGSFGTSSGSVSSWYTRKGYVTEVKAKFGPPWHYATGKPMFCELSFTFLIALVPMGGDMSTERGQSLDPKDVWKFTQQ